MNNRNEPVPPLEAFDLADLLNEELPPETPEHAYRRGYRDAVMVLWSNNITARRFDEQLEQFFSQELLAWVKGDTSKEIFPPEFKPKKKV